jgi:hypothetical protein
MLIINEINNFTAFVRLNEKLPSKQKFSHFATQHVFYEFHKNWGIDQLPFDIVF